MASTAPGARPETVRFDYEKLSAGHASGADRQSGQSWSAMAHRGPAPCGSSTPRRSIENPAGKVGEIWVHGDNVADGYWRNPQQTELTFGARLVDPSPGTPPGPWLRTGDLGVISDGELFIIGRIKDLLIVDGRNHYPDDIEATIQEITGGRVAAISVPDDQQRATGRDRRDEEARGLRRRRSCTGCAPSNEQ